MSAAAGAWPGVLPFDLAWHEAWGKAFIGQGGWIGPLVTHVAEDATTGNRAILGLARQAKGLMRVQSLAGYYWPCRGLGVAASAGLPAVCMQIATKVTSSQGGPVLRMGPVATDDHGTSALIGALCRLGWRGLMRQTGVLMRLQLPEGVTDAAAFASTSMLKNLAYLRRRLEKQHGAVVCERVSLRQTDTPSLLKRLARIEQASWVAGDGGEPKFVGAANQAFWLALACAASPQWEPVVWLLHIDGEDVAFSAHLEAGPVTWIIANSYAASWKAHSPGSLLTYAVLQHAMGHGVRVVDWGQGDSGYKGRWGAKDEAGLQEYLMFRPSLVGRAMHLAAKRALADWSDI